MLVIENCNSLSDLRQKLIDGEEVRTVRQEPCEDAISRQAVQDYIAKYLSQYLYNDVREAVEVIDEYIGELSSVNPTKTGHWIFVDKAHEHAHCSECDYGDVDLLDGRPHNYCPNCGAKMVELQERSGEEC